MGRILSSPVLDSGTDAAEISDKNCGKHSFSLDRIPFASYDNKRFVITTERMNAMKFSFTKMQGCANDYIYLDCRACGVPEDIAAAGRGSSPARHFSVGADGIICICAPVTEGADGRHAHLQRRRQRGADVRQRRALRGRVAAMHQRRCERDARAEDRHQQRHQDASPTGAHELWQVEMGGLLRHGCGPARCEHGRRAAGGLPPRRGRRQDVAASPASAWATPTASPLCRRWTA